MNLMVTADNNWAIGSKNRLLVRIPNDQKLFRQETEGRVVVYGRRALETLPQGLPLPGRTNIVLSSNPAFRVKDALTVHSLEALLEELKKYPSEEVYVAGGESVYRALLPYCSVVHATRIDHAYEADAYFPDLDKDPGWQITAEGDELTYFDLPYRFVKYERCPASL